MSDVLHQCSEVCFVEIGQHSNDPFDEFVGEKVFSPSYSSTILGPPLWFDPLLEQLIKIRETNVTHIYSQCYIGDYQQ